jgi:hypothetical protein
VFALTDFEVVIFWAMALPVKADVDAATDMVERSCAMRSAGRAGRARDRIEVAADSRSLGGGGGGPPPPGASQDSTCRVFDTNVTTLGATRTIIRAYRPDLDLDLDLDLDPRTRA